MNILWKYRDYVWKWEKEEKNDRKWESEREAQAKMNKRPAFRASERARDLAERWIVLKAETFGLHFIVWYYKSHFRFRTLNM